ncbi:MAG: hypothetical protein MHM6MM_004417 [Cercozoa sp. M6MM]
MRKSRNSFLIPGVPALSRTKAAKLSGRGKAAKTARFEKKAVAKAATGKYPAHDQKVRLNTRKRNAKPSKKAAKIAAGDVLILLAGRFAGKKVVALKPLANGTVLVSGPFKLNGVPLRMVNPAYVIRTSVNVEVGAALDKVASVDVSFFAKDKSFKKTSKFLETEVAKNELPEAKKALQKEVDAELVKGVKAVPQLGAYLKAKFSLSAGQYPHLMKF